MIVLCVGAGPILSMVLSRERAVFSVGRGLAGNSPPWGPVLVKYSWREFLLRIRGSVGWFDAISAISGLEFFFSALSRCVSP